MTEEPRHAEQDPFALDDVTTSGAVATRIMMQHCVGRPNRYFMFGGIGMALATRAIERRIGQPLRWLTIQFITPTLLGSRLELSIERLVGDRVAQLALTGRVDDEIVMRGLAAVGRRAASSSIQAAPMPAVPPPEACEPIRAHDHAEHDVHQIVEIRLVKGRFGVFSKAPVSPDGHVQVWMRPRGEPVDAAMLALMADFVPSIVSNALDARAGGSSLDNTVRIVRIVPTGWVLCDISIAAITDGIGHGEMKLFAEDGTLMAIASQSFIARVPTPRASTRP